MEENKKPDERVLIDYKKEPNVSLIKEIQAEVCNSLGLNPDDKQGIRYANRAFKAVVKRVNNPYFNVLEEYYDEIIDIAIYNHNKDMETNGKKAIRQSQGPLSVEYANTVSVTEIPSYLINSIRHFVGGF